MVQGILILVIFFAFAALMMTKKMQTIPLKKSLSAKLHTLYSMHHNMSPLRMDILPTKGLSLP